MWRQVKLKEKRNVIEFDLKNVSAKKHKETKKACILFKSIIFVKKHVLHLLMSNSKTLTKKKSHFWRFRFLKVLQDREAGLLHSKKIFFICFNDSLFEMMKIAFYFILKAFFILKIFNVLFWLFGHVEEMTWIER